MRSKKTTSQAGEVCPSACYKTLRLLYYHPQKSLTQKPVPKIRTSQSCSSRLLSIPLRNFLICIFDTSLQHILKCTLFYIYSDMESLIKQPASSDACVLITRQNKEFLCISKALKSPISRLCHAHPGDERIFLIIAQTKIFIRSPSCQQIGQKEHMQSIFMFFVITVHILKCNIRCVLVCGLSFLLFSIQAVHIGVDKKNTAFNLYLIPTHMASPFAVSRLTRTDSKTRAVPDFRRIYWLLTAFAQSYHQTSFPVSAIKQRLVQGISRYLSIQCHDVFQDL